MKTAQRRTFEPRFAKPVGQYCEGCSLHLPGQGFVPACGAEDAPILFVGESPWFDEVAQGQPFTGAAGSMLGRVLRLLGTVRESYRMDNILRCAVPNMELKPWRSAIQQCRYLDETLAEGHRVVVPLGTDALRRVLQLPPGGETGVEHFHGTVQRDPEDRFWVVPSYHPSYLQRGAVNLIGTMVFDLQRAHTVATHGWAPDPGTLLIDPPLDTFRLWARQYIDGVRREGAWAFPLAVDIETPEKAANEGTLIGTTADASYRILRVNFSCHPDEGVTVPWEFGYIETILEVLGAGGMQYYWYKGYDYPRLAKQGAATPAAQALDAMWMWKVLQSDLPQSLGFVAPFYSTWGAWKHLSASEPAKYGAIDGLQTRRVGDGCVADLIAANRWATFERHLHDFHRIVLQPATDVGVPIDRPRLLAFKEKLDAEARRLCLEMSALLPPELRQRTPPQGLTRPPAPGVLHAHARTVKRDGTPKKDAPDPVKAELYRQAKVIEVLTLKKVLVCKTCGKVDVQKRHACERSLPGIDRQSRPILVEEVASVPRWYWEEPYNPDSPKQLLQYVLAKGYTPGKSKTTGNASVDRETLTRLYSQTQDPFFDGMLRYRAVQKVRGTYVEGTLKRLDAEDRVHPETTFKPSTMRTSQTNPNIQNVVADKGGKDSLAAGFRHVVVARGQWVDADSPYADAPEGGTSHEA